jgi:hypothetical protein
MCIRSVARARAFYVKGLCFVEQGAVEFHIAVGMWPSDSCCAKYVASRQARLT